MCIAIIKPVLSAVPSMELFEHCFKVNPDGAGFAYSDGEKFIVRKGLMSFEDFKKELEKVLNKKPAGWSTERAMAFHFRIGTHGSKDAPGHTHPFPITERTVALNYTSCSAKRIAMHNGILSGWGDSKWPMKKVGEGSDDSLSDTMEFIRDFVAPLQNAIGTKSLYDNSKLQNMIGREVAGSRFVIMEPDGRFLYWGAWEKHDGCLYSNSGYKVPKKADASLLGCVNTGTGYRKRDWCGYDYDDDYDYERNFPSTTDMREWPRQTESPSASKKARDSSKLGENFESKTLKDLIAKGIIPSGKDISDAAQFLWLYNFGPAAVAHFSSGDCMLAEDCLGNGFLSYVDQSVYEYEGEGNFVYVGPYSRLTYDGEKVRAERKEAEKDKAKAAPVEK